MSKIYTKTGDQGETGLWGGRRVSKSHPRVEAYGEVDELNSLLGLALTSIPQKSDFERCRASLTRIQKELFALGAVLATPPEEAAKLTPPFDQGIPLKLSEILESEIDAMNKDLKLLRHFILPGGSEPAAWIYVARAVCRRAERKAVELKEMDLVPENALVYLNRLSDYLFTTARWINQQLQCPETEWQGLTEKNK